ncbi:glycosyltransferase family 2 protein [Limnoglobus roseus]|uniref:GT2 family glycosyltransferase n=1 Tax=Limnoglobus roseus TaxID=2598579 RepID=A0A5C1A9R0_9BACT|nr:glycosyltransferase family 2 protein [Limnoglobus roseus]QEL16109.1 GT2 family glycosyltransferase [Limnoglobus roseus]
MTADPVGILIVNYNGGPHLSACLTALERQTVPRYRFEVIVLDNASRDGSADGIPTRFPWVRLVRSSENLGFAEGNNVAARYAHGDTVILLNNDTIPDPYWLEELLRATAEHPGHTPASKLVFADRPDVMNSAGLCLLRDGRGMDAGFELRDGGQFEAGGPVFAGCGAAVVLRKDAAGNVLDPDYFLYYEDLDAGWRNELTGMHAVAAPRSLVRHVHGAAAGGESPVFRFHVDRNRALASLRNADAFLAVWAGFLLLAKVPQAFLRLARGKVRRRNAVAVLGAFLSYLDRLPGTLVDRYLTRCWHVRRGG